MLLDLVDTRPADPEIGGVVIPLLVFVFCWIDEFLEESFDARDQIFGLLGVFKLHGLFPYPFDVFQLIQRSARSSSHIVLL